ncbi:MAG: hypothetical protein GWP05_01620 [Anaerolineaceae bacterium]|nr:hypothetical protein [Anaerolineaceae bacterium]
MTGEFLYISSDELERARQRVGEPEWQPAAERLRAEAERLQGGDGPLPEFDRSWYDADPDRSHRETYAAFHDYVCPVNRLMADAWTLLRAGAVFGDERFLETARTWTLHVADRFRYHVTHYDSGMEFARMSDAMAEAYAGLGDRLDDDQRGRLGRALAACGEAIRLSHQQWLSDPYLVHMPYNNHMIWHQRGLLGIGLALGRQDWIDEALNGPRNFGEMLVGATRDDGLCYESSTLYHFATLDGLLRTAELVRHRPDLDRDLYRETFANGRSLKQMLDAPLGLLLPNGELPSLGDCYARREPLWRTHQWFYEIGFAVYGDPRYAWLLGRAGERTSFEALMFGADRLEPAEPPPGRTRLWIEHGYALLTSRTGAGYWESRPAGRGSGVVAVLTGDLSGIHHHKDSLGLEVFAAGRLWVEDVESRAVEEHGFSDPIQEAFNRTVLAHNTVMVNGQDQREIQRPLVVTEFKELPSCRTVTMADRPGRIYDGVGMMRSVAVTPDYCLDLHQVCSSAEHTCDWLVHPRGDGPVRCDLDFSETALPSTEGQPGWAVLRNASSAAVDAGGATLSWTQDGLAFRLDVSSGREATLLRAEWPVAGDWSEGGREMFAYRVRCRKADFVALYQVTGGEGLWQVAGCRRVDNGLTDEMHVTVSNGRETREHIFEGL